MNKKKPFKSLRITLSDDAVVMLDGLKKSGKFRSHSATIEEAIRTLHELVTEHLAVSYRMGFLKNIENGEERFKRYEMMFMNFGDTAFKRLTRFVGLDRPRVLLEKDEARETPRNI